MIADLTERHKTRPAGDVALGHAGRGSGTSGPRRQAADRVRRRPRPAHSFFPGRAI